MVDPLSLSPPHDVAVHSKADGRAVLEVRKRDMFRIVPGGEGRSIDFL